jgi:hypothetical protein
MSVQELGAIAGIILSLGIAYIPYFANKYNQLDQAGKARVMGALLVVSALGVFGLGCANLLGFVPCTIDGAKTLLGVLIAALVANQATFSLLVHPFKK